jgi:predicted nucleic acid-binding protein
VGCPRDLNLGRGDPNLRDPNLCNRGHDKAESSDHPSVSPKVDFVMRLLLDTSVLIDALRARRERRSWLAELVRAGHSLETSALNVAEVYAGMRPAEEEQTKAFLGALMCHPVSAGAGENAGRLKGQWARKGRTLTLADTIVAAAAMEQGCALATDNRKDFPMAEVRLFDVPE